MNLLRKILSLVVALATVFSVVAAQAKAKDADKPKDPNLMRKLDVKSSDKGGTLLFSDSPEYVHADGILYSDVVKGDVRLLFYHLNDTDVDKRIAVVVDNLSNKKNVIKISRGVVGEPGVDYLQVGKSVQTAYMQETFNYSLYMDKGERNFLIEDVSNHLVKPQQLLYGIYDFHTSGKVRVSVVMCPQDEDPLEFVSNAKILSKDKHRLRGTFQKMNRTINIKKTYDPDADGVMYVMLADNVNDLYKKGIDATDGSQTQNYGNYGIIYTINLNIKEGTRARICLTPLGGYYAGAMRVTYKGETKRILTPDDRTYFGDKTPGEPESVKKAREQGTSYLSSIVELAELGIYDGGKVSFEYSPPGASNLPVHLILMPVGDDDTPAESETPDKTE